mgnify:CR=1 FL=1
MHMKLKKDNRIELRFALIGPGTMWNLLYEGMDQSVNLRSIFKGKDEESILASFEEPTEMQVFGWGSDIDLSLIHI